MGDEMVIIKSPGKPSGLLSGGRFVTFTNPSTEQALKKAGVKVVNVDATDRERFAKGFAPLQRREDGAK